MENNFDTLYRKIMGSPPLYSPEKGDWEQLEKRLSSSQHPPAASPPIHWLAWSGWVFFLLSMLYFHWNQQRLIDRWDERFLALESINQRTDTLVKSKIIYQYDTVYQYVSTQKLSNQESVAFAPLRDLRLGADASTPNASSTSATLAPATPNEKSYPLANWENPGLPATGNSVPSLTDTPFANQTRSRIPFSQSPLISNRVSKVLLEQPSSEALAVPWATPAAPPAPKLPLLTQLKQLLPSQIRLGVTGMAASAFQEETGVLLGPGVGLSLYFGPRFALSAGWEAGVVKGHSEAEHYPKGLPRPTLNTGEYLHEAHYEWHPQYMPLYAHWNVLSRPNWRVDLLAGTLWQQTGRQELTFEIKNETGIERRTSLDTQDNQWLLANVQAGFGMEYLLGPRLALRGEVATKVPLGNFNTPGIAYTMQSRLGLWYTFLP